MVVTCEHCGARYRLDKDRIQGKGARITCPQCSHVFVVYREGAEAAAPAPAADRPTDVHALDFKSVGITTWKVKTSIGLVYDFSDYKTLRKYLKEGRVSETDTLSHNGDDWSVISDVGDLETHFIDAYVAANAAIEQASADAAPDNADEADSASAESIASELLDKLNTAEEEPSPVAPPEPEAEPASAGDIADELLAAVEAAATESESGIELDMDSLLEEAAQAVGGQQAPPSARRGSEQKAVQAVAKTGSEDTNPHQFVDPFEALKQSREAKATGRKRRNTKKKAAADAEAKQKRTRYIILGGLLACAVAAIIGVRQPVDEEVSQAPTPAQLKKVEDEAKAAALEKHAADTRQRMQKELNAALKDVEVEEINAFSVEENQLIAKIPDEFRKGAKAKAPFAPPIGRGLPAASGGSDVSQRSMSAADHMSMGDQAKRSGRYDEAATAYKAALAMNPTNAGLRAKLGHALFKDGKMDSAEVELRAALSAGAVAAHKYLGHMAREQGDISGANSHYQSYLRSGPADARAIEIMIQQMTP